MHRFARFARLLFTIAILTAPSLAQLGTLQPAPQPAPPNLPSASSQPDDKSPEKAKETLVRHQAALTLLDLVLAGSRNLSLPQNRIAIASDAFPILWTRNQPQASTTGRSCSTASASSAPGGCAS